MKEFCVVEVSKGRIHWSNNLSAEAEIEDGFYVFSNDFGEGAEAGPFEDEKDAEAAMEELSRV